MTEVSILNQLFEVKPHDDGFLVNGENLNPDIEKLHPKLWHLIHNHNSVKVFVNKIDKEKRTVSLTVNGKPVEVSLSTREEKLLKSIGMDAAMVKKVDALRAPMPGLVHSIQVNEGDEVEEGDVLLILEAMKMENVIKSPTTGTVSKIHINAKDSVEKNEVLLSFS